MIGILIAGFAGILCGIITGITPGIHINLVAAILLSISNILPFAPEHYIFFLLALGITHTFLDSIPSILLGVPDDSTIISALPGHQMALGGYAYEAIKFTLYGSYSSILISILLMPAMIFFIPFLSLFSDKIIIPILIFFLLINSWHEPTLSKKLWSLATVASSGILGILILHSHHLTNPFFHLLSGMFGIASLIQSMTEHHSLPQQYVTDCEVPTKQIILPGFISTLAGTIVSVIPGIGSTHAAMFAMPFTGWSNQIYLIVQGGINTAGMIVSFATLATIGKARNGLVSALQEFFKPGYYDLFTIVSFVLIISSISVWLTIYSARLSINIVQRVPYQKILITLTIFLLIVSMLLDGLPGFIAIISSTFVGLIPIASQTRRSTLMGSLLVPLIIFYSGG